MSQQSVIMFEIHDSDTIWESTSTDFVGFFFFPSKIPHVYLEATFLSTQALPRVR